VRGVHVALAVSASLLLWADRYSDLDLLVADWMFDHASGTFPWRGAWLADRFNHAILKSWLQVLGVATLAVAAWDWWRPRPGWTASRRIGLRVLASAAVLVPTVVSLLKRVSASHCPWDLQRYGGSEPYVRLLEAVPAGVSSGHCMPAGHASGALWLLALAVFWLPHQPRKAAAAGAAMLVFGFTVGWIQQLRGAHFLTHTLWSIWIAVLIVDSLYRYFAPVPLKKL
jgi:membrane-associated PAP2 superfamily phosphatase